MSIYNFPFIIVKSSYLRTGDAFKMFRKTILILVLTVSLSLITSAIMKLAFDLLAWTNTLFLCSLFLLILGGVLLVVQGQFFAGIIRSFKHFSRTVSNAERVIREAEGKSDDFDKPFKLEFKLTFPLLLSGLILFSITLICSIILW